MNKRRGLKRLAIAIGVPYFGFWVIWAWSGFRSSDYARRELDNLNADSSDTRRMSLVDLLDDAEHRISDAVMWGLFWPLIALIVASIGYWVYRGFKHKL